MFSVQCKNLRPTLKAVADLKKSFYSEVGTINARAAEDLVQFLKNALISQKYFSGMSLSGATLKRKAQKGQPLLIGFATEVMYHSIRAFRSESSERIGFYVGWPDNLYNREYSGKGDRMRVSTYASRFNDKFPWFDHACEDWANKNFPGYEEIVSRAMYDKFFKEYEG